MSAIFEFYAQFTLPAGRKQLSRRVGRCELGIKTDWWVRPVPRTVHKHATDHSSAVVLTRLISLTSVGVVGTWTAPL